MEGVDVHLVLNIGNNRSSFRCSVLDDILRSWALDFSKGMSRATTGVLLMNPLRVAVMSELLIRTPRELFPKRSMIRWKGSVFFRTPVSAIRAITVRMEGLTAVA